MGSQRPLCAVMSLAPRQPTSDVIENNAVSETSLQLKKKLQTGLN